MEYDLETTAKAILVGKKIDKMLDIIEQAKELRKALAPEYKEVLSVAHEIEGLDPLSVALGLTKVSDEFFEDFETTLYEISELAHDKIDTMKLKNVELIEGLIVFISELKPRSLRHLENFISATTDGEWVDGLMVGHGRDSEFRCIDHCSDDTKEEFGLKKK